MVKGLKNQSCEIELSKVSFLKSHNFDALIQLSCYHMSFSAGENSSQNSEAA